MTPHTPKQAAMAVKNPIKINSPINQFSFLCDFDNVHNTSPAMNNTMTDALPNVKSVIRLMSSYSMIPASITPPNTNLAMSIMNFPVSDNMVSFCSFSITPALNVCKCSLFPFIFQASTAKRASSLTILPAVSRSRPSRRIRRASRGCPCSFQWHARPTGRCARSPCRAVRAR